MFCVFSFYVNFIYAFFLFFFFLLLLLSCLLHLLLHFNVILCVSFSRVLLILVLLIDAFMPVLLLSF